MQINRITGPARIVGGYTTKITYESPEDLPCFKDRIVVPKADGSGVTVIPIEKRSGVVRSGNIAGSTMYINGVVVTSVCDMCTLAETCSDKSSGVIMCRKAALRETAE